MLYCGNFYFLLIFNLNSVVIMGFSVKKRSLDSAFFKKNAEKNFSAFSTLFMNFAQII